jgi:DeoR/GlpR family transcriptional regulator of sugar metabolism
MDGKLTDNSIEENSLRRIMLCHAKKRVLLCDSSKLGHIYLNNLCHLSEVDEIICERALPTSLCDIVGTSF